MIEQTNTTIDTGLLWNNIATTVFCIIGLFIFLRSWRYISSEMKTAPKNTFMQKIANKFATFLFSGMVAVSITLVLALVSSTIAINAIFAIQGVETEVTEEMITAWFWPTFIPVSLMLITLFAFLYPLYEYIQLARPQKEGPMEVQKWIETNVIDRANYPWTYFVSIGFYILIVIIPPSIISLISIYVIDIPSRSGLSAGWVIGFIFFVWLLIGPIFYLSYYANIGTAHAFFRGTKVNLKKDKFTAFFFFIAILSIFSTIFSFFQFIPIIWGQLPETTTNYTETQAGFLQNTILLILRQIPNLTPEQYEQWQLFFAIVPIDFLLFLITTAFFGMLGFYMKFLSKEPLNRPTMVLFAAYIFCGIAFTIFMNIMIKWPWIFPDDNLGIIGLNLDMSNPKDQQTIVRLFSTAILVEKILNIFFIVNFLIVSKEIKQNADEWVLNRAIIQNDFEIIAKYAKSPNPEVRKMVAYSIVGYVKLREKLTPESSQHIAQVLSDMILDENEEVANIFKINLNEIIKKLWLDVVVNTLISLLKAKEPTKHKQAITILKQIARQDLSRVKRAFMRLLNEPLVESGKHEVFQTLGEIAQNAKKLVPDLLLPLLPNQTNPFMLENILSTIKGTISEFENNPIVIAETQRLFFHSNTQLVLLALEINGSIGASNKEVLQFFVENINKINTESLAIFRQKLGALVKFIIWQPDQFKIIFPFFESLLDPEKAQIEASSSTIHRSKKSGSKAEQDKEMEIINGDLAISLGTIATAVDPEVFNEDIFPHLISLVQNPSNEVKKATLAALVMIAKTRPDIYEQLQFQLLFGKLLIDPNVDLRHGTYQFLLEGDPQTLLNYIAGYLSEPLELLVRIDLLNLMANIAEKVIPNIESLNLLEILMKQNFSETIRLKKEAFCQIIQDTTGVFCLPDSPEEIDLINATITLLLEFCIHRPQLYISIRTFIEQNRDKLSELSHAKLIEFYGKSLVNLMKDPTNGVKVIELTDFFKNAISQLKSKSVLIEQTVVQALVEFYGLSPEHHIPVFEMLYTLASEKRNQKELVNWTPTQAKIIQGIGKIVADHVDTYFNEAVISIPPGDNQKKVNAFKEFLREVFIQNMESSQTEIQAAISQAYADIFAQVSIHDAESRSEEQVQADTGLQQLKTMLTHKSPKRLMYELLVDAVKSSNENSKLSGLRAFNLLDLAIDDNVIIKLLKKQLKHRNPLIKAEAITILGKIMLKFPIAEDFKKDQVAKLLKNLVYNVLYLPYQIQTPLPVKTAICTFSTQILMQQPNIPYIQQTLGKIGMDQVPPLASKAIDALFNWIKNFPEKLEEITPLIREIANNLIPEVSETVVKGIIRLKKEGLSIESLLPTLFRLATSPTKDIRAQTLGAIGDFYANEPEKFTFYFDLIVGLTRNRIPEFRLEAIKNITKYIFRRPEFAEQSNQIFNALQNLSRDMDYLIKFTIASNLKQMITTFPKRINEALFICYSFMRGSERDIKENTALAIKDIWKSYPNQKGQIMTNLQRYYRKSQDSVILTLIDELKMMDKEHKQPPIIADNEQKSEKSE